MMDDNDTRSVDEMTEAELLETSLHALQEITDSLAIGNVKQAVNWLMYAVSDLHTVVSRLIERDTEEE